MWNLNERAEDKGFEPSTGFPAPDFESDFAQSLQAEKAGPAPIVE